LVDPATCDTSSQILGRTGDCADCPGSTFPDETGRSCKSNVCSLTDIESNAQKTNTLPTPMLSSTFASPESGGVDEYASDIDALGSTFTVVKVAVRKGTELAEAEVLVDGLPCTTLPATVVDDAEHACSSVITGKEITLKLKSGKSLSFDLFTVIGARIFARKNFGAFSNFRVKVDTVEKCKSCTAYQYPKADGLTCESKTCGSAFEILDTRGVCHECDEGLLPDKYAQTCK